MTNYVVTFLLGGWLGGRTMTTLFEKPVLGDEYSPKKNAPLIFMPVTLIAVIFGICGIIANLIVLIDGTDGVCILHHGTC